MTGIRFPLLTTERYLNAVEAAKAQIIKRIQEPTEAQFKTVSANAYPVWFVVCVLIALALVMFFSFWISAGKEAAAVGLVLDDLPSKYSRLSQTWADLSVGFMLGMGESGAVLFLVAAGTVAVMAGTSNIFGRNINITAWIFRGFALLCASYAVVSNVTITLTDPVASASVLQWLVSVGNPLTVLGLGVLLERIVIDALRAGSERKTRLNQALAEYGEVLTNPERHEYYKRALFDCLYSEIIRYKAERDILANVLPTVETDQQYKRWLVGSEYQAHIDQANYELDGASIPFLSHQISDSAA